MAVRTYDVAYFLAEMAAYVAVVWWAASRSVPVLARIGLGAGALVVFATAWALFAAPRAVLPLSGVADVAFRVAWFGTAAVAAGAVLMAQA